MSVAAAARRFHEEGLGSRTGLRIDHVQRNDQGFEDLDAFFAESKRALEMAEMSDEESSVRSAEPEYAPDDWNARALRVSERAARTLGSRQPLDLDDVVASTRVRSSMPSGADETLWESTMDISRNERTFVLSSREDESAGGLSAAIRSEQALFESTPRSQTATSRVPSLFGSTPQYSSEPDMDMQPSSMRMSTPMQVQIPRTSYVPEDLPSFLRPEASLVSDGSERAGTSFAPAGTPALPPIDDDVPPIDAYDAPLSDAGYDAPEGSDAEYDEPTRVPHVAAVPAPPVKRGRGRPRKSQQLMPPPRGRPGRPPGRQKAPQKIVERIHDPPSWQLQNPTGLRRGRRHRIAPLDWWRGERALYGRPDEPAGDGGTDGHVAPVLKEVIRVPRLPGEGTFAGMRRFRPKPVPYAEDDPRAYRTYARADTDDESEAGSAAAPEAGCDADTDPLGYVVDPDRGREVEMRIACPASDVRPIPAFNQQFLYEKIFGVGDFMAAGMLVIPTGGEKPTKPSKDNNYTFVVLKGAVQVMVHRARFVIAPGGMFLVPKGNTYNIRNVGHREARIFFAQARNLAAPLHDVVQDGQTVFAHGREHVEVEPDAEADADATDASSGSDDPDASGDYELRA